MASTSPAALKIDSSLSEATANITLTGGATDTVSFKTSITNSFSATIFGPRNLSLDIFGSKGQGSYSFNVGTVATRLLPQDRWNIGVSANTGYSVSSNQANLISSSERFHSLLDFTITNQLYHVDFVQILSQLSSLPSVAPNLLTFNGSLASNTLGTLYQVNATRDNTGATTFNSSFPSTFTLTPGSYRLEMDIFGQRSGVYNLSNIQALGAISLSLIPVAAVPEPASLVLCGCIGMLGAPRIRRFLKQRKASK
jgi:hypothetical protein